MRLVKSLTETKVDFPANLRGRTYAKKLRFFTQKKSRLRKSENAVRLLYAKTVTSHIKMRLVFSVFVPSREGL